MDGSNSHDASLRSYVEGVQHGKADWVQMYRHGIEHCAEPQTEDVTVDGTMHFPPGTPNLLEGGDVKTTMTYRFLAQRDPSKSSLPILAMAERLMREGQVGMRLGITAAEAEDAFDALNRFASTAWRHFDYAEMEVRLLALGANLRNKRKTWEAPEFQQRRETSTEPAGRPSAKQKALNRKKAKAAKKARRK